MTDSSQEYSSLIEDCNNLIKGSSDPNIQTEIYRVVDVLLRARGSVNPIDSDQFSSRIKSIIAAIQSEQPNLQLISEIRNQLDLKLRNQTKGFVSHIRIWLDDSPVYAMLVGIPCSFVFWLVILACSIVTTGALDTLFEMKVGFRNADIIIVCGGALLGAYVSLITRMNYFANLYIYDPFLIFVNSFFKPIIAGIFAVTVYAILFSGLVKIAGLEVLINTTSDSNSFAQHAALLWVIGFLSGFSERFATDLVSRAEGVVSPAKDGRNSASAS